MANEAKEATPSDRTPRRPRPTRTEIEDAARQLVRADEALISAANERHAAEARFDDLILRLSASLLPPVAFEGHIIRRTEPEEKDEFFVRRMFAVEPVSGFAAWFDGAEAE
jgi:hypothetical protein